MPDWEGKRSIVVVTACIRADGSADFVLTEVELTADEYANGVHYDLVEDRLADTRYEEPFVHFDQFEAPEFLIPAVKDYLAAAPDHCSNQENPDAAHHRDDRLAQG